jgi:signal transduction histidine kinase
MWQEDFVMNAGQGTGGPAAHDPRTTRELVAGTAALLLGGLAAILAGAPAVVAIALAAGGVLLAAWAWAPAAFARVRRGRGWILVLAIAAVLAWWVARSVSLISQTGLPALEPSFPERGASVGRPDLIGRGPLVAVSVLLAIAGLVLVSDAVRVWIGLTPRQRPPWKQMTDVQPRATPIVWRVVSGVVLVVVAALLTIDLAGAYIAGNPMLEGLMLMVVVAAAITIVGTPLVVGALIRFDQDRSGGARERDRQRFAAHLHDSVLQTLALVQRQANDPVAVARLARRQEYSLRAWMAGEAELHAETLGSALRDAVAEVEDEHGLTIEQTGIGDRSLDETAEILVAAAREALRNAARHGGGAPVYVFFEISPRDAAIFIRDEGPGFELEQVAVERRGIRDAILGRMESAGGSATIESAPGEGTEVALWIGPSATAR